MRKGALILILFGLSLVGWAQHDCPAFPKRGTFDQATFIRTAIPTDPAKSEGIWLGEGIIMRNGVEERRAFIPDNRPDHAIAIAHAWNYHRNLVHRIESPHIGYWLATVVQESEYMCEPNAVWSDPNEAPLLYNINYPAYLGRANTLESGASGTAGCYQIEGPSGSAWFQLGQNYPQGRFPQQQWQNLAGGDGTFTMAALVKSYYDVYTKEVYQYQKGWDVYEAIDCALDPYAYEKASASGYNGGINAFGSNQSYFTSNPASWNGMAATTGGYGDDVAKWISVLENNTAYFDYPTGSTFGGYYNEDISWSDVTDYLSQLESMYSEITFATDVTPNVQAAFVELAGSTAGTIPFQQLGPVVDEIILALPREYPQIVEGSPIGINPTTCSGEKIPYAGIEVLAGPTDLKPGELRLCLGESVTLQIHVEGGGGASPTYKWYKNSDPGTILSTELQYTVTPTAVGSESYGVEVCNDDGCYKIGSNTENGCQDPRNANGFWVITDDCSTCSFVASATKVNTPCKGMSAGSITLSLTNAPANYRVTYSANTPLGVINESFTSSGNTVTIPDVRDGSYSFELEDLSDPSCKAFTNVVVGFDTDINEYVDAEITGVANCVADIEANIVELPQPCTWKVWAYVPVFFRWDLQTLASVRTSTGLLSTDAYTRIAPRPELDQWNDVELYELEFELYTGDEVFFGTSLTTALGSQLRDLQFELYDETGTMVYDVLSPAGSAQPNSPPIEVGSYTVTCPYTPPAAYNFAWSPSLSNVSNTTISSTGQASVQPATDVTYVVTATNASNPTCVLTDSVTVIQDPSCVPSCDDPGTVQLQNGGSDISGTIDVCASDLSGPGYAISVTETGSGTFNYQLFKDNVSQGAAGASNTFTLSAAGDYYVLVIDANDASNTACQKSSNTITINETDVPSAPSFTTSTLSVCPNTNGVAYEVGSVSGADDYTWSYTGTGASFNPASPSGTTASVDFGGSATGGNIEVTANNSCGSSSAGSVTITIEGVPSTPGTITLPGTVCKGGSGYAASIAAVSGADDYTWGYTGTGVTISGTTNSVTFDVTAGATAGILQ